MRVFISPSNQTDNPYTGIPTTEAAQCDRIAVNLAQALRNAGYEVRVGASGATMATKVSQANAWGADLYVCVHTDAGGGRGATVMCHSSRVSHPIVQAVYAALSAYTPPADRGIKARSDLYEINTPTALTVYCECSFHDNTEDAAWIVANVAGIGQAIANGIITATGGTPTPTPATATPAPASSGPLVVDGISGPATWTLYQARRGLTQDGVAGTDTITDLQNLTGAPIVDGWYDGQRDDLMADYWPNLTAYRGGGTASPGVRALQRFLGVEADGILGPDTAKAFQRALNEGRI